MSLGNQLKYTCLVLLLCASSLEAQDYNFDYQYFGPEDGLPHREVNAICEDSKGFIWVGTKEGLCRFDGYNFQLYSAARFGFLTDNFGYIYELPDGALALIPYGPVENFDIWNPYTGSHTTFNEKYDKAGKVGLEKTHNLNWCQDKAKNIYFQDPEQSMVWKINTRNGLTGINLPAENLRLLSADDAIWLLDTKNPRIYRINENGKVLHIENLAGIPSKIYEFVPNSDPVLFFTHNDGSGFKSTLYGISKGAVYKKFDFTGSHLYFFPVCEAGSNTADCLLLYNGKVHTQKGKVLFDLKNSVTDQVVNLERIITTDSRGRVWMGNDFGIRVLTIHKNRFKNYFTQNSGPILGENACRGVLFSNHALWVNLERQGLFRADPATGTAQQIYQKDNGHLYTALISLRNGNLALAYARFVRIISPEGKEIKCSPELEATVWTVHERQDGKIWVGTEKGLSLYDPQNGTALRYADVPGFGALRNVTAYWFHDISASRMLLCTNQGLFEMEPDKGIIQRFWKKGTGKYTLPAEAVYHLHQDPDGTYWLATDNGLIHLEINKRKEVQGVLHHFTKAEGLSNNILYAVYPDKSDKLWLSSDYGIMRFNKTTGQVKAFLKKDGICDNEFNRIAHARDERGYIYFGSINGITGFNPDDLLKGKEDKPLEMVITRYQQFDGKANKMVDLTRELWQSNTIVIQPNDRFFQIDFALLSLEQANLNYYAYRIDGVDNEWNYLKEHTLRFGRLPYGKHLLRIKGQDASGKWSENELLISIQVLKPFYLQSWFIVLLSLLLIFLAVYYLRYRMFALEERNKALEKRVLERTATIEKQAAELRRLDQMKSRFFANVSHELRTPLTLMLGPINTVLREADLNEKCSVLLQNARQSGNNILGLINEILDLSKLEAGKMTLNETPFNLKELLHKIEAQFQSHAHFKGVELEFKNHVDNGDWVLLDKKKMEHIVSNLLSNAIKFTDKGGKVTLNCTLDAGIIRIEVADNGRGIHPDDLPFIFDRYYQGKHGSLAAEGGTGIGLSLSMELCELMNGSIHAKSSSGNGSIFFLELPYKSAGQPESSMHWGDSTESGKYLLHLSNQTLAGSNELPRILVVEDDQGLQQLLILILQEKFTVDTASNGLEALAYLEKGNVPDLIISDVMMPQMDGFQLLERIKGDDRYRHLPVIMLTARADLADKLHALHLGVDDYLLKPFEEEELLARVRNLVRFAELRTRRHTLGEQNSGNPDSTTAPTSFLNSNDANWLKQLEKTIEDNIENPQLNVDFLAAAMNISTRHLQRQVKTISGLSILQYIQEARLQHSRQLLENGGLLVKQVAGKVGYKDVKHFTRLYKERFGKLPSDAVEHDY